MDTALTATKCVAKTLSKRLDRVVHVGVDAQLAGDGERLAHDGFGVEIGVIEQGLGGGVRIGPARSDGDEDHPAGLQLECDGKDHR